MDDVCLVGNLLVLLGRHVNAAQRLLLLAGGRHVALRKRGARGEGGALLLKHCQALYHAVDDGLGMPTATTTLGSTICS